MKYYTGVGSRKTPTEILYLMKDFATILALKNLILRSGGADGADREFEYGCDLVNGKKEIYLAKHCTVKAQEIAKQFHPAWHKCSPYAQLLHGRNVFQVLGKNFDLPSSFLICWTPDGCKTHKTRKIKTGGTGTEISIADHYNVPVYNLKRKEDLEALKLLLQESNQCLKLA